MRGLTAPALAVGIAWFASIVLAWWYTRETGVRVPLCVFRRVTGMPCPGCGGTRCVMSLLGGDPAAAVAFNPLLTAALVAGPLWLGWRMLRGPGSPWPPRTRMVAGVAALAVLAANWVYVLWHEGWLS